MKDFLSILKRIIIGIGIALCLMFIKGNLCYIVHAEELKWSPDRIYISGTDSTYSATTQYFKNDTNQVYYSTRSIIKWVDYSDIYYRYSQMSTYNSCSSTDNNVSLSGSIASFGSTTSGGLSSHTGVSVEYVDTKERVSCTTTYVDDFKINFTCYFVANQSIDIILEDVWSDNNIDEWKYGISRNFNISCSEPPPPPPTTEEQIGSDISDIKDSLTDDNVDDSISKGSSFFNNFKSNNHGLSGIITAPLRLLNSFTTATCTPLTFQLPILHDEVTLPCMRAIYEEYFGIFFSLYQLITTGLICYHILINIYKKVRDLQNPNNDRIEVLNL